MSEVSKRFRQGSGIFNHCLRVAVQALHHLDEELAQVDRTIVRERYADFGPTLACEKLRELHGIDLLKKTVRKLMSAVGLWIPRSQRSARIYEPRNRRNCVGDLVQIDGSDHHWFEGRGPACALLGYAIFNRLNSNLAPYIRRLNLFRRHFYWDAAHGISPKPFQTSFHKFGHLKS